VESVVPGVNDDGFAGYLLFLQILLAFPLLLQSIHLQILFEISLVKSNVVVALSEERL